MLYGFAITKVCYDDNEKRDKIKCVKAARFWNKDGRKIESMGSLVSWTKEQIIEMIADTSENTRVFTATVKDDYYSIVSELEVYTNNGAKYIRAKGSTSERDDLDELPLYEARINSCHS